MTSKYTYRELDQAVDLIIKRLYALGKDTGELILADMGPYNYKHRTLYATCEIIREIFGIESYIKTNPVNYFKIVSFAPKGQKRLKSTFFKKINKETEIIYAPGFLAAIEDDLQKPGILDDVYQKYYEVKAWQ